MTQSIETYQNHVIIAGFSEYGRVIAKQLAMTLREVVILERCPERCAEAKHRGFTTVCGVESEDDLLVTAGAFRASHLVVAMEDFEIAIATCLSAHALNPHLEIVARAAREDQLGKMRKAGARTVIVPDRSAGIDTVNAIANPRVADLLSRSANPDEDVALAEIVVSKGSRLIGRTLKSCGAEEASELSFVALEREGLDLHFPPKGTTVLAENDILVVWGRPSQVQIMLNAATTLVPAG
ncbi:MAG: TrkA family potassium uptake protein [Planctomycetota bacterium]